MYSNSNAHTPTRPAVLARNKLQMLSTHMYSQPQPTKSSHNLAQLSHSCPPPPCNYFVRHADSEFKVQGCIFQQKSILQCFSLILH